MKRFGENNKVSKYNYRHFQVGVRWVHSCSLIRCKVLHIWTVLFSLLSLWYLFVCQVCDNSLTLAVNVINPLGIIKQHIDARWTLSCSVIFKYRGIANIINMLRGSYIKKETKIFSQKRDHNLVLKKILIRILIVVIIYERSCFDF